MTDAAPREGWYIVTPQGGSPICAHRSLKGQWGINGMNVGHDLPPGWTLGPAIDDLLRDAARYRWLISKRRTYKEGARIAQWFDDRDLCPSEDEISAMIDAEIAREKGRADG